MQARRMGRLFFPRVRGWSVEGCGGGETEKRGRRENARLKTVVPPLILEQIPLSSSLTRTEFDRAEDSSHDDERRAEVERVEARRPGTVRNAGVDGADVVDDGED